MDSAPPVEVLRPFERFAVRLVRRMNTGRWQRCWFWCAREIGARWIGVVTGPLLDVCGLEHVAATTRERPLLIAANHRSFFDLYVVMSLLFRRLPGWRAILFPVRGRYFYQRTGGVLVNALAAWWSMYPPFFHDRQKKRFDQWALDQLVALCREGRGRLIGYHPEGHRNPNPDPYSFLPPRSGIGRLILEARPQVVPVFIAGLGNSATNLLARRLRGGERIRIRFGPALKMEDVDRAASVGSHRAVTELVMREIRRLAEADRAAQLSATADVVGPEALA